MIDFPNAPATSQVFTTAGVSWLWDTVKWQAVATSPAILPPPLQMTISATVPNGYWGAVEVRNSTAAPLSVTLPVTPAMGQTIIVKDALGNASNYPITILATNIDGNPSYALMYDYGSIEVYWMGTQWGTR